MRRPLLKHKADGDSLSGWWQPALTSPVAANSSAEGKRDRRSRGATLREDLGSLHNQADTIRWTSNRAIRKAITRRRTGCFISIIWRR